MREEVMLLVHSLTQIPQFASILSISSVIQTLLKIIAPSVVTLGFVGMGLIRWGSTLPIINTLRCDKPITLYTFLIGLRILIGVSAVVTVIVFS
jgi:hypothetical protein